MLTIAEALDAVISEARACPEFQPDRATHSAAYWPRTCGLTPILPRSTRRSVDGYAVRARTEAPTCDSRWASSSRPGEPHAALLVAEAAVIMTGAPLPRGCDAVIMHERTPRDRRIVTIESDIDPARSKPPAARRRDAIGRTHPLRRIVLHPAKLGVLASVGRTEVQAIPRPVSHRIHGRRAG